MNRHALSASTPLPGGSLTLLLNTQLLAHWMHRYMQAEPAFFSVWCERTHSQSSIQKPSRARFVLYMTRPAGATALELPVVLCGCAANVPPQAGRWADRAGLRRAETISVHSAQDQDCTRQPTCLLAKTELTRLLRLTAA
jgi:hypothetical protein